MDAGGHSGASSSEDVLKLNMMVNALQVVREWRPSLSCSLLN